MIDRIYNNIIINNNRLVIIIYSKIVLCIN